MTETKELENILRIAIEVEINGMESFARFAEKTQNANGKKMFQRLAKDEKEHKDILEKQLEQLNKDGTWKEIQIPESKIEALIPKVREKEIRTKGEAKLGEINALNTALELERKSAQFYKDQANKVSDSRARQLFLSLAEWENSHYDLVQAELDSVNNTGMWFGIPEFRMDGQY